MNKVRRFHGTLTVFFNCITAEYRIVTAKPLGSGWDDGNDMSYEDIELINKGG